MESLVLPHITFLPVFDGTKAAESANSRLHNGHLYHDPVNTLFQQWT